MRSTISFCCSGLTCFIFFAGTPAYIHPLSTRIPDVTSALAATMAPLSTTASSSTVAPIPTRLLLSMVAPWMVALCPIDTLSPITVFERLYSVCTTAPSCMFTLLPMVMLFTSPRSTVPYQMEQLSPIVTSPMTAAVSAMKQSLPIAGLNPRISLIIAIVVYLFSVTGAAPSPPFALLRLL